MDYTKPWFFVIQCDDGAKQFTFSNGLVADVFPTFRDVCCFKKKTSQDVPPENQQQVDFIT